MKMCELGFTVSGSSIAVARTLHVSDSGQPPPKMFDPQERQNVFAVPSAGWKVWSRSSPSITRIDADGTLRFAVAGPPESFLQLAQWQYRSVSGSPSSSNRTPPQRQLPRSAILADATPMRSIWKRDVVAPVGLGLIALGAANELAVALGWIALGDEPGEGPRPVETALAAAGWLAILVAAVFYVVVRLRSGERVVWAEPLLAFAAAAYMVALF